MINGLQAAVKERVLTLDGAMGTMVQRYKLDEAAFRGERFRDFPFPLKGNNDILVLTQPQVIREIHEQYLEAGADIIETDTFNGTRISTGRLSYRGVCLRAECGSSQAGERNGE